MVFPIYGKNGEVIDWSDGGEAKEKMESDVNIYFLLKTLSEAQRIAVVMKIDGFSNKEIAEKMKISRQKLRGIFKKVKNKLNPPIAGKIGGGS